MKNLPKNIDDESIVTVTIPHQISPKVETFVDTEDFILSMHEKAIENAGESDGVATFDEAVDELADDMHDAYAFTVSEAIKFVLSDKQGHQIAKAQDAVYVELRDELDIDLRK